MNELLARRVRRSACVAQAAAALVVAAGLLLALGAPSAAAPPAIGTTAPDFSLATPDGTMIHLSALRGKIVVVNFFATWCPPCRAETQDLIHTSADFSRRGVVFVGVDVKEPGDLVTQFAAAKGVDFALVLDSDGKVNEAYDVRAIPTTYIVGRDGRIQYRQVDQLEGTVLASALNDVVAGRLPNESALARRFAATAASGAQRINVFVAQGKAALAKGDKNAALLAARNGVDTGVAANKQLDALQNADGSSSINYFESLQQRDALGSALAGAYELRVAVKPGAAAKSDREQALLLRGQQAQDEERFAQALALFQQAAALAPRDTKALDGIYLAAFEMRDYATAESAAETEARIAPKDPESWLTLASSYNSLKRYDDALAAEGSALALATVDYARHVPKKYAAHDAAYEVGRVFLKMGRTAILAGDTTLAAALLPNSPVITPGTIVAQQAQEQYAALSPEPVYVAVSGPDQAAAAASQQASLWLLVRNGAPQPRTVHLAAVNVPKKWVLSFCYEKVCDPYKSDVSLAANESRRVELRVVPLLPTGGPWKMQLQAGGVDQMNVDVNAKTQKASISVLAS
jgi:peroxiredoxin